jgi:ribose transport system ATP-binding protein
MVGRDLDHDQLRPRTAKGDVALRVVDLNAGEKVRNVSFEAHRGQILGFAGLMGSGRTETMRAIFGADKRASGRIYVAGSDKPAAIDNPADAVNNGIALLTEDRKQQGLFLPFSLRHNISVTNLPKLSRLGWISRAAETDVADKYCQALSIKCSSTGQLAGQLSGGNQQKVVIAKWLFKDTDVMIFDEPTRGIDVGAKFEIYRLLGDLAARGKAIVMVSSDLLELMAVCDRIAVMSNGYLAEIIDRDDFSEEAVMTAALSRYAKKSESSTV